MKPPVYIRAYNACNALGNTIDAVFDAMMRGRRALYFESDILPDLPCPAGEMRHLSRVLVTFSRGRFASRCHRILDVCIEPLMPYIQACKAAYPLSRLGVVVGTSASGTSSIEAKWRAEGRFDFDYHYLHSFECVVRFLKEITGFAGPAYTVSTACSSGANAMISAVYLLQSGICDAVLTGGVDALSLTTYRGFHALQIMDERPCRPFRADRKGLNLGEGAGLFLLTRQPFQPGETSKGRLIVAGFGAGSDAYHMTAPDPGGGGAYLAMSSALASAGLSPSAIGYINLHGTGTPLNDEMEAGVVYRLFGTVTPCSSTKGYAGHLLGGAAAVEAAICLKVLETGILPPNMGDGPPDTNIKITLVESPEHRLDIHYVLNNSFAFGGNNTCMVFGMEA